MQFGIEKFYTLVVYLDKPLFRRHPFNAEHPLARKRCNAKFLQICSDEETTLDHLHPGWPEGEYIFILG